MPLDIPVFDADNHLYETKESLTKFLPDRYKHAIDYVDVRGRTKIVIRGPDQRVHPQPHLRRRGPPRRAGGLLPQGQPRRQEPPRDLRRADAGHPRLPRAGAPPRADGRAGPRPHAHVPDAGQPPRGAHARRSRPRRTSPSTRSTSGCTRRGSSTTRTASSPRRSSPSPIVEKAIEELEWVVERGARVVLIRPAPAWGFQGPRSFALPEFDPFWAKVVEHDILVALHSSDSGYERYTNDWMGNEQRDAAVPAAGLPHAVAVAPGRGRGRVAHLPRRAVPVPDAQGRGDRERQQLGRAARCGTWPTSTRRCRRTSRRTRSRSSSGTST